MNEQFRVAQANGAGHSNNASPPRIFKLTKPFADQAVVLNLGYDQKVQVDFSAISNEKITLVHVGEKLIILFDNHSTVTVEPFFDSRHDQLGNLTIEVAPGRDLSVAEFASAFPIINDPSAASAVLPAAGDSLGQNNAQASGANFSNPIVDPLPPVGTNTLAPNEDLSSDFGPGPTGFVPQPTTPPAPTISLGALPELVVDESFLTAATNGIDGSGTGPAGTTVASGVLPVTLNVPGGEQSLTFALSISAPGVDTGLIDSQTGNHVFLFVENGVVVGREGKDAAAAANGPQDFTVSVDGSGKLTLTDLRSVHEGTGEPGDVSEGTHVPAGLISLTATVTDNSNQSASASADVGPHLTLLDDGPSISALVERELPFLGVDESNLPNGTTPNPAFTHDSGNFSGAFSHVEGADGATITYALAASGATGTSGVDSGLVDSGTGHTVFLFLQGGEIIGREGTDPTSAAGGAEVFTIELNSTSGEVTLTQLRAVHETTAPLPEGSPDISEGISLNSVPNLVTLVATITDADGDTASASMDLGRQIGFFDDGIKLDLTSTPTLGALEVVEASGALGDQTLTIGAPTFTAIGADGVTTTTSYALSLVGPTATGIVTTDGNHPITLHFDSATQISGIYNDGVSDQTAFTITLS
ncbi:DUF5801 repeats-in-toxin domain-containing protein, partial [Bradyrhizobium sp. GCM10027634]|uniref:DUF5801 repeats-in-toxin domain-containing protein n=1 Tax=unclassified Bradyrhizobium TaxID=2631580 RepID=UPI00263A451E